MSKEEIKQRAEEVARALGYDTTTLSHDLINMLDMYCMGYAFGSKLKDEYAKQEAFGMAKFADDNHFRRNRASNMWFDNEFKFYTEDEFYELYQKSKQ